MTIGPHAARTVLGTNRLYCAIAANRASNSARTPLSDRSSPSACPA
ncbi:hypothetical protein ABZS66_35680 [Dactylosporangium sp. NPDC005572]